MTKQKLSQKSPLVVQSTNLTTSPGGTPKFIYDNKNYYVVVGYPPASTAHPNPIPAYLVINKETGVTEYWESVLFYAKQRADLFSDMLEGKFGNSPIEIIEQEDVLPGEKKVKGTFN